MTPLAQTHWKQLNRLTLEIHSVNSRKELLDVASRNLPATLGAEHVRWCEHGEAAPADRACSSDCFHNTVLGLVLDTTGSKRSCPSNASSCDGVFDLAAIDCSGRLRKSARENIASHTGARHYIVTQFFISSHHGVLLMVGNSRPFTDVQRITLSLLREHLAIAARRHHPPCSRAANRQPFFEPSALSRREKEILPCLTQGMTNPEIAISLGISPRTVEKHVASILDKAGLDNRRMLIGRPIALSASHSPHKNG